MKLKLSLLVVFLTTIISTSAQESDADRVKLFEVYGFAMTDAGYNFNQINPSWSDALRITRLPKYKDQFAPDGTTFFGVRQSRLGVKGYTQTPVGELKTCFEFDMFGVGVDEGQTTIRLRHAYGEIGRFLAGQTNSVFMDGDVFPNIVEYWGPTGMVFYRNVQIRYAPVVGCNEVFLSLERPGASADKGPFEDRIELDSVRGHLMLPDFALHYKRSGNWGHAQFAGMLRSLKWDDIHTSGGYDLGGSVLGWGVHVSTVININKNNVFRGSFVYGEGVENYMNDAPVDVGIARASSGLGIEGEALPVMGIMAFIEHNWTKKLYTVAGYSSTDITNSNFGSPDAYKKGQYGIVNLVSTPWENVMMAAEFQWGKRNNFTDGFNADIVKFQFSFKYNFSKAFYKRS